jgi:hypothetical protein
MTRPAEPAVPPEDLNQLEQILRRQLTDHERMLVCLERNREAIRQADMDAIKSVCEEQNAIVQQLAELEKSRLVVVGRLTQRLRPQAPAPLSMSQIAEALDEPAGRRLSALAAQLRNAVEEVRAASAVLKAAGQALARHMSGLMQTVQSALTRARVYSPRGQLALGAQSRYAIDLTS